MTFHLRSGRCGRAAAAGLVALIGLGSVLPAMPARAAEPDTAAGARHLAETLGGSPNDFLLLHERTLEIAHDGGALWSAKYLDQRTGNVHIVHRDAAQGATAGGDLPAARLEAAVAQLTPMQAKADDELMAAVAAGAVPQVGAAETENAAPVAATVPVGIWLNVDVTSAEQAVAARHPELTWDGDRPLVGDLATARAIRAELAAAQAVAREVAFQQFATEVAALGGSVAYASTTAPLAYVDVPASAVEALAALPLVASLGLERTWTPTMSSAGPAAQADWTSGADDLGNGIRVAVVEYHNVRNSGDLAGRVVASYSTSGTLAYASGSTFDHPTWVAGAIASGNGTYRGVAPGALIVSASTGGGGVSLARDRNIIAAADWAASSSGGDADIINASIGQDTGTGSEEARRYFDSLVHEQGRLAVAAAGNYVTFGNWDIASPGTAYNVLTVGGLDDRGTAGRGDDRLWYYPGSNGGSYRDVPGASWNPHGDFNKPNVSASGASVRTANGLAASGTSISSPIVSGIAAQILARMPTLLLRPEGTRAILMAGAINRTPMPDGSLNADHEGTGTASALWAGRLLTAGDSARGGHSIGTLTPGQIVSQEISVVAGQKVKVVVAWNSHTSGSNISTRSDRLMSDLDLRVFQPDGSVAGSYSFDNNYEWVEFTATQTGTARIEVRPTRFDAAFERYGLAWAKWSVGTPIRIAGPDRYATAATISATHFSGGAPVAYVATGRNFPDALAGGPAAGLHGGPVLLTEPHSLPQATRDELSRLRPGRIVVLGGPGAISTEVARQLEAYTTGAVRRLEGQDRYATAAAVSRATYNENVGSVFIATGEAFPDALAAGPAAIHVGGPVLLARRTGIPQPTRDELARLSPGTIYVIGGPGAISDAVLQDLQNYTSRPVVRIAGADRYETATRVSAAFFNQPPSVHLATGTNFPDALAAVSPAGRSGSPLLLVAGSTVPNVVTNELLRLEPPRCLINGGSGVIGDSVAGYLVSLLGRP